MQLEQLSLDRAGAAEAVGITEAQIANWVTKYGMFPEKRQGKGAHFFFLLTDVVALATVKVLIDAKMAAPEAVAAVKPYSPYGTLLHDPAGPFTYPGTFFLAQNHDDRWVGMDSDKVKVSIEVRMWPVFDEVFPRFCEQLRQRTGALSPERLEEIIDEYRVRIEDLRMQRWG